MIFSGTKYEHSWARIGDNKIWESNAVKLLCVTIDNKLKFDRHIPYICFKANQKLVLIRLMSFFTFDKKRILFKALFEFQFNYCPLSWMLCVCVCVCVCVCECVCVFLFSFTVKAFPD